MNKYMPLVLEYAAAHADVAPGTIQVVRVLHDDWCGIFKAQACNCNPVLDPGPLFQIVAAPEQGREP